MQPTTHPKRPQAHYRPFSTLYTDSDIEPRRLKRSSSLGGLHSFRGMNLGLSFKPKKHAQLCVTPPASPTSQSGTPSQKVSYPLSLKQRLKTNQDGTTSQNSLHPPSIKKKRSVMSLFSPASTHPDPPERPTDIPEESPRPSTAKSVKFKTPDDFDNHSDPDSFVRKTVWTTRFNMKLHPYQTEVPYMQAYNSILLENDRYTDLLLQRLSGGYPSFGHHRAKPPLRVLDLGCGQGTWILYAANIWSHTHFTGFDLVNITTPAFEAMDNTTFVQGNFINFPLPFADASFDFVRLANLVLCVPYTHWDKLLREVKRILCVGGRIELIDDEIFFPYANPPKLRDHLLPSSSPRKRHRSSASSFDMDDDDLFSDADLDGDTLQGYESGEDSMFNHSETTCVSSSFDDKEIDQQQPFLSSSETARPSSYARWRRHASTTSAASSSSPSSSSTLFSPTSTISSTSTSSDPYAKPPITDPYLAQPAHVIWAQRAAASRELEAAFLGMLSGSYGVYPRPAEFVSEFMQNIFGKKAGKTQSYRVRLAEWGSPIGVCADVGVAEGADGKVEGEEEREGREREKKQWMAGRDSDKKKARRKEQVLGDAGLASERASVSMDVSLASPIPDVVKPKAAKQLGMDMSLPFPIPDVVKPKAAKQLGLLIPPSTTTTTSPSKSKGYSSSGSTSPSTPSSPVSFSSSSSTPTSAGTPVGSGGSSSSSSLVSSKQHSPVKMTQPKAPNAKTAALLGMSYNELVAATSKALQASTASTNAQAAARHSQHQNHKHKHSSQHHSEKHQRHQEEQAQECEQPQQIFRFKPAGLVQSPGLLVGRDRYIAVDARELEMHACKYMHTLLGCRPALAAYVARFQDEMGRLIVEEDMFTYYLWEYETFRRTRLGWPSQIPEKDDDDPLPTIDESQETASTFNSKPSSSYRAADTPQHQVFDCQPDETVHIRTIRVFQAVKMGSVEEEQEEDDGKEKEWQGEWDGEDGMRFSRLGCELMFDVPFSNGGGSAGMKEWERRWQGQWEKERVEL